MEDLKTLQNTILDIAIDFDEFCKRHDIKYFLMGGSALGAIRHKGFIPWDDDMDVFMDYYNYVKFISAAQTELDTEKYHFQIADGKENPFHFCKIRKNGTTFIDGYNQSPDVHQGIFIDIMCLNYVSENKFVRKMQYYVAGMLKAKAAAANGYKVKSFKKKFQTLVSKILVNPLTKKAMLKFVRKCNKKKTSIFGHFFGRAKFANSCYPVEWINEQVDGDFENVKLPVCNGVHEYLVARYGKDYMQMPSMETRAIYQSHAVYWDTKKDYKEYLKEQADKQNAI